MLTTGVITFQMDDTHLSIVCVLHSNSFRLKECRYIYIYEEDDDDDSQVMIIVLPEWLNE
jgi:hypothetical protein